MDDNAAAISGAATGGTPPSGSSAPLPPSSGSSSPSSAPRVERGWNVLAWATFFLIGYAWLCTEKLDHTPTWQIISALVANALPGGMLGEIAKTAVVALVDKIPGRGAGK